MLFNEKQVWFLTILAYAVTFAGCDGTGAISQSDSAAESSTSGKGEKNPYSQWFGTRLQEQAEKKRAAFFMEHGATNSVEVIVTGADTNSSNAFHFLVYKIHRAAYYDYQKAVEASLEETRANKKAAIKKARAEYREKHKGRFGPGETRYKYKQVMSKLDQTHTDFGPFQQGTYIFYTGPVLDLQAFVKRVGVGEATNINSQSRRIIIRSTLPTPLPDLDLVKLEDRFGADKVVTMKVSQAEGDMLAVQTYLGLKASQLDPAINLDVVGPKSIGTDRYEMSIAPVGDLEALAERIRFGKVIEIDVENRLVKVQAKLPDPLPTLLATNKTDGDKIDYRLSDEEPQPGESKIDWALRIIKGGGTVREKALNTLATMKPDPAERERVSATLVKKFGGMESYAETYLKPMANWQTPELASAIANAVRKVSIDSLPRYIKLLSSMNVPEATDNAAKALAERLQKDRIVAHFDNYLDALDRLGRSELAIAALKKRIEQDPSKYHVARAAEEMARYKTTEVCKVLFSLLDREFVGDYAMKALNKMGLVAEPVGLKMLENADPERRLAGANLLYQIGAPKGIDALGEAIRQEDVPKIKKQLEKVRRALVAKLKNPPTTSAPNAETTTDIGQSGKGKAKPSGGDGVPADR